MPELRSASGPGQLPIFRRLRTTLYPLEHRLPSFRRVRTTLYPPERRLLSFRRVRTTLYPPERRLLSFRRVRTTLYPPERRLLSFRRVRTTLYPPERRLLFNCVEDELLGRARRAPRVSLGRASAPLGVDARTALSEGVGPSLSGLRNGLRDSPTFPDYAQGAPKLKRYSP